MLDILLIILIIKLFVSKYICISQLDDVSIRKAFESGVDLRQYSAKLQEQLQSAHLLAVKDCIDQAEKLAELHEEITACDDAFAVKFNFFLFHR